LGKTFIAAVVMYNFYRWFPEGKIIFMAPTKPLVAQQIEACHNVVGIPQHDTAEMTGQMLPKEREKQWPTKRVFFVTPHVLANDIKKGICPARMIVCLVVDEAHRAQGNFSYCQVIKEVSSVTRYFRVLALSATPGTYQRKRLYWIFCQFKDHLLQQMIFELRISNTISRTL
jgi:Fanconi anemia group M protein